MKNSMESGQPSTTSRVLIVGASAAGMATANALRRGGYAGRIRMLGEEKELPYDRPPLSKQFLTGTWDESKIRLVPQNRLDELDIELLLGRRAVDVDIASRVVRDAQRMDHPYDALVIATGLAPRVLEGFDVGGVHVLRTVADAVSLRAALRVNARVLVVGGGFLGLEIAATATSLGANVTVVEPVESSLAGRIGPEAADRLYALHRSHGVDVRLGVGVSGPPERERPEDHMTMRLTDGSQVEIDSVVLAVGATPRTDWLEGSGIPLDNGVVCDEACQAVPGVWAAGDVARWYHRDLKTHMRVEHRTNATEQGQTVAAAILGKPSGYRPVPFFWTDQFDARVQLAGLIPIGAHGTVVSGAIIEDRFVIKYAVDGLTVGVLGWNSPRDVAVARRALLEESTSRDLLRDMVPT